MEEPERAAESFMKAYEAARQQYEGLPPLEALDEEWDILETLARNRHFPRNAVRFTRWHMLGALGGWAAYLHEFIMPNAQNAVLMEEYNYFDDKEKQGMIEMLNWIMYRTRSGHTLQLEEDDAKSAEFIGTVWKEWHERKPLLRTVIAKNVDAWKQKVDAIRKD